MFYVTMNDRFMSGWGLSAGKINKYVVACKTFDQAAQIAANAKKRDEMTHVNICVRKPSYPSSRYYVSWKNYSELSGSWKTVIEGAGFCINYDEESKFFGGDVVTILSQTVAPYEQYALKGDHRKAYSQPNHTNFTACKAYYDRQKDLQISTK